MYTETKDQDIEALMRKLLGSEDHTPTRTYPTDSQKDTRQSDKKQVNRFGSPYGEEREVVIRYRIGDEQNAVLSVHSDGSHGATEDSLAVAYSLGQLVKLGINTTDISAKAISSRIINAIVDGIVDEVCKSLLRIIEKEAKNGNDT